MTRKWPFGGLALAVLWLFVQGVKLTPQALARETLVGLGVGMPIAFAVRRLFRPTLAVSRSIRAVPYAGLYVVVFLYEVVTANLEVAYRVLAPNMPIHPDVVEVPLRIETDLAITTIANSITLTPGTLTMDYDPDRNSLYVHAIAGQDRDAILEPIRQWEEYALVIFDERRDPGDPVPDPDRVAAASDPAPSTAEKAGSDGPPDGDADPSTAESADSDDGTGPASDEPVEGGEGGGV